MQHQFPVYQLLRLNTKYHVILGGSESFSDNIFPCNCDCFRCPAGSYQDICCKVKESMRGALEKKLKNRQLDNFIPELILFDVIIEVGLGGSSVDTIINFIGYKERESGVSVSDCKVVGRFLFTGDCHLITNQMMLMILRNEVMIEANKGVYLGLAQGYNDYTAEEADNLIESTGSLPPRHPVLERSPAIFPE